VDFFVFRGLPSLSALNLVESTTVAVNMFWTSSGQRFFGEDLLCYHNTESLQEETELEVKFPRRMKAVALAKGRYRPGIDQECIKKWRENIAYALWRERML